MLLPFKGGEALLAECPHCGVIVESKRPEGQYSLRMLNGPPGERGLTLNGEVVHLCEVAHE